MSEKKMISRNVAISLGIACIILIAGLGGAIAYYTTQINDKDNTISSLNSQLSNVINEFSNYEFFKDSYVIANNRTVTAMADYVGGYAGNDIGFSALYSGYVSVTINDSTENPTTVGLVYFNLGYTFNYRLEIPINGTSYLPVTGSQRTGINESGDIQILFKNPVYADDNATVTVIYYY
jgi:predicted PurR-regulated permease PerM